jgi:hypothetical protein
MPAEDEFDSDEKRPGIDSYQNIAFSAELFTFKGIVSKGFGFDNFGLRNEQREVS